MATEAIAKPGPVRKAQPASRVVFTEGGKGGVGKTAFSSLLVEWYGKQNTPHALLDLDTENKARGSLAHYFSKARKVNIHTSEGLDSFVDVLDVGTPIVIADMGAGAGAVAHRWFDSMFSSVEEAGVAFTAIGIVTPDPASVESVLAWAGALQHRVQYLIVRNSLTDPADFSYWDNDTARQGLPPRASAQGNRHGVPACEGGKSRTRTWMPAHDELFHLAQLLGFLSLLGQRLPEALNEVLTEFRLQAKATRDYRTLVEERLARLPEEIASGVDLDRTIQTMGESFRQQLAAVGLENTVTILRSSTQDVSALSGEISTALKLVTQEYKGVAATISTELGKLTEASSQVRAHNAKLMVQERWNAWLWQVLLALLLFLIGGLCGVAVEKRQVINVHASGPRMDRSQTTDKKASWSAPSKKEAKHLE